MSSNVGPIEIDYKSVGKTILELLNGKKFKEELQDELKKDALNFIIMGASGVGKSSTLNNLIENVTVDGKPAMAKVGNTGESLTKDITVFRGTMLGQPLQQKSLGNTNMDFQTLTGYLRNIGQSE